MSLRTTKNRVSGEVIIMERTEHVLVLDWNQDPHQGGLSLGKRVSLSCLKLHSVMFRTVKE